MSLRTIPTTQRSREHDRAMPELQVGWYDYEIAKAAGTSREAVSLLRRRAERKFRRVWALWESVGWDEKRKAEIRRELQAIEDEP